MKRFFPTSNRKILYLTMLIDCKKNLDQSDLTDCKLLTVEGKKSFFHGVPRLYKMI
jgi:hypothetical protein